VKNCLSPVGNYFKLENLLIISVQVIFAQLTDNNLQEGDKTDPAINPLYDYYEWENSIPENCPFVSSKDLSKVIFTGRYANYTGVDNRYLQSGNDGNMYSCWKDEAINGFSMNSNIPSQLINDDGFMEWMYAVPSSGAKTPADVNFPSKKIKWVNFTITKGIAEATKTSKIEPGKRLLISEIEIFDGINY
jgi:hypothetical protein